MNYTKQDFALFLRKETGQGIFDCAVGVNKLIEAFKHRPKPIMDKPCKLVIKWEYEEE